MFIYIIFFLLTRIQPFSASNVEYDGWLTIKLQHALIPGIKPEFTDRGNITIQSLRTGSSTIVQSPLKEDEKEKIQKLSIDDKFYLLKSIVSHNDGSETVFLSSVKACMLAEAQLSDILSISLDYSGKVVAVSLAVASTSTCQGASVPVEKLPSFITTVFVRHTDNGPIPDTASYIQKLEKERDAKERGEVKDNRSFLAKYWIYIVPVVLLMVLSSIANPEAGGAAAAR